MHLTHTMTVKKSQKFINAFIYVSKLSYLSLVGLQVSPEGVCDPLLQIIHAILGYCIFCLARFTDLGLILTDKDTSKQIMIRRTNN